MEKLIDIDKLIIDIGRNAKLSVSQFAEVCEIIKQAEGADVVHCKDCKHQSKVWITDKRRKEKGYFIYGCKFEDFEMLGADDDFCSYGERKDNERKAD